MPAAILEGLAISALSGVGDSSLGEWIEQGDIAVHVRRRLNTSEESRIGPAVDIRGTPEAAKRIERAKSELDPSIIAMLPAE